MGSEMCIRDSPTGNDEIEDGDTVMIVTKNTGFTGIDDIVR